MLLEELFEQGSGELSRGDVNLLLFPHLKEFLVIDLRGDSPDVCAIHADDVFDGDFFDQLENEFSKMLKEDTEYPFSHLMGISIQVEELIRELGMVAILKRLKIAEFDDEQPLVAVFIMGGSTLLSTDNGIGYIMNSLFDETIDPDLRAHYVAHVSNFVSREREVVEGLERSELREALQDESPNFFTLWQQRN